MIYDPVPIAKFIFLEKMSENRVKLTNRLNGKTCSI